MTVEVLLSQRDRRVVTVPMNKTLKATVTLMRSENVDAVVITDICATEGEAVFGVLTRQDVIDALADYGLAAFAKPVSKLKTGNLVYCDVKLPVSRLIAMMQERAARYAVVMDHDSLVGLVNVSDILFSGYAAFAPAYGSGVN